MAMSRSQFERAVREAQRKAEREVQREIGRVNRANNKAADDYNREVERHIQKVVDDINRQLAGGARRTVSYRPSEQVLVKRVQGSINFDDGREYDVFLSYARIDGEAVATELAKALEALGVRVWFDAVAIQPGKSQSLQMDAGLRKARAGIAVLTAAYLAGRFWTQRDLGALLNKPTLIPVLHD